MLQKRKNSIILMVALMLVATMTSCFKIGRTAANGRMESKHRQHCRVVAITDGYDGHNPAVGYGVAGIRVPSTWRVTTADDAYVQYADPYVIIDGDTEANCTDRMVAYETYRKILNETNPKDGYTWHVFVTENAHKCKIATSQEGAADSIAVNFVVTPKGTGEYYDIDFMVGFCEGSLESKQTKDQVTGSRIYEASTEQSKSGNYFDHVSTQYRQRVLVVNDGSGVMQMIKDDDVTVRSAGGEVEVTLAENLAGARVTVYDYNGVMCDTQVVDGTATLRAHGGMTIVTVVKNGAKVVKKLTVK